MSMDFVPALDGVSDHCAICHKKVQLWNIGGGPSANGMLILDPETQRSHAVSLRLRGPGGAPLGDGPSRLLCARKQP